MTWPRLGASVWAFLALAPLGLLLLSGCGQTSPAPNANVNSVPPAGQSSVPPRPAAASVPIAQAPLTPTVSAPAPPAAQPALTPAAAQAAAPNAVAADNLPPGRKVFEANGCTRCHAVGGQATASAGPGGPGAGGAPPAGFGGAAPGGPGGGGPMPAGPIGMARARGPELSTVGTKRTRDWLIEHVRNPKAHNPQSRMPAYDGKISDADLQLLANYLASLK